MGYLAYDLVTHLISLLALPLLPLLWLTRHGEGLAERLGRIDPKILRLDRPIWIHAASVGEVLSVQPLVVALRRRYPRRPILVSTTSLTGRATARAKLRPDAAMLLPVDLRWIVARALRRLRPWCLLIAETELWPGLLRAARDHGVPVMIVSGRVTPNSARQYAKLKPLTRSMLTEVALLAMQTPQDAERIIDLGARPDRVHVVGSLKYAREARPVNRSSPLREWLLARPLLVAASTQPGEEELVVGACETLWGTTPGLLLAIAPRRPERFDEVAQWLQRQGIPCERRSQLQAAPAAGTRVLVIDTIGELLDVFPLARAVFVGGSIAPLGGHNVLEPAMFAKPVMFGPHTENVAAAAETLLAAGAAVRVQTAEDLAVAWREVLAHPERAAELGERGREVVAAEADVAERTIELVEPLLDGLPT